MRPCLQTSSLEIRVGRKPFPWELYVDSDPNCVKGSQTQPLVPHSVDKMVYQGTANKQSSSVHEIP